MLRAYAVEAVREAERRAMAQLPEGELMQRAARALAREIADRVARRGGPVVVLVGPGDNGGDALWAAAMLAEESPDLDLRVLLLAEPVHAEGRAAVDRAGLPLHAVDAAGPDGTARAWLAEAAVVVDGLLGIGGRAGLRGPMAQVADQVGGSAYRIAVDLPSGADPAGTEPAEHLLAADETISFGTLKPVHLLPVTEGAVGRVTPVDIGIAPAGAPVVERLEASDVAGLWPVPHRGDDKYTRGVLGVVAGGERYPGAAVLACTAAVASGAGMVRYVGPPTPTGLVLQDVPEVVPGEGRVQAWVVGPGIDAGDDSAAGREQAEAVRRALRSEVPCLVDAGALEIFAELLQEGPRRAPTLLTPHAGELARLLTGLGAGEGPGDGPDAVSPEDVRADPVGHARRAAELTGATVLLKGATTLVVDPGTGDDPRTAPLRSQADAPAWLATAGAGDVLAGVCGTLLAAGLAPREAGSLGALVHGLAAHRANPGGPVRARAVARALPATIADLLRQA